MNEELELFRLLCTDRNKYGYPLATEISWRGKECICWVSYIWISEFAKELIRIFGEGCFDDGGIEVCLLSDGIGFDLCKVFEGYVDIESMFPKEEFQ